MKPLKTLVVCLMGVGLAITWPAVAEAASGKLTGRVVVNDFENCLPNHSYMAVDPATGRTRSLGIPACLDAGFNSQLTKAAVVRILTSNGQEPYTSSLSIKPLGKGRSTTLWTFNSGAVLGLPQWSPTGSQIAMALSAGTTDTGMAGTPPPVRAGLWVINVANHTHRLLVDGEKHEVSEPAWSPNGQTVAYLYRGNSGSLAIDSVSVTGKAQPKTIAALPYTADPTSLSWSPDGKTLLVCEVVDLTTPGWKSSEVDTYPVTGGPPTTILAPVSTNTMAFMAVTTAYQGAAYSPTGQSVAVAFYDKPPPDPSTTSLYYPAVSVPGSPLPVFSTQILNVAGRSPHTSHNLTNLKERDVRLVGWYPG